MTLKRDQVLYNHRLLSGLVELNSMCLTRLSPVFVAAVLFAHAHGSGCETQPSERLQGETQSQPGLKKVAHIPELFNQVSGFSSQHDRLGLRGTCGDLKQSTASLMFDLTQKSTTDLIQASLNGQAARQLPPNFRLNLSEYMLSRYIRYSEFRARVDGLVEDAEKQIWSSETKLFLGYTSVSEISAISKFTELEWLQLNGTAVTELGPLVNLKKLTNLYLRYCRGLTTESGSLDRIEPLRDLPKLRYLDLAGTDLPDIPTVGFFSHSVAYINTQGELLRTD